MKFKLVENIDGGHKNVSSNDILNENREDMYMNVVLSILSNQRYPAGGFISNLPDNKKSIVRNKLQSYCNTNGYNYDDVQRHWEVHHINGVHPISYKDKDNQFSNLAMISPQAHAYFTQRNKELVKQEFEKVTVTGNSEIDKLIGLTVATCMIQKVTPSSIFRKSIIRYKQVINGLRNTISENFKDEKKQFKDEIILFDEFMSMK